MQHHVDQLRMLLTVVNPAHLGKADYLALLSLARAIPAANTAGGGRVFQASRPESPFGETVA